MEDSETNAHGLDLSNVNSLDETSLEKANMLPLVKLKSLESQLKRELRQNQTKEVSVNLETENTKTGDVESKEISVKSERENSHTGDVQPKEVSVNLKESPLKESDDDKIEKSKKSDIQLTGNNEGTLLDEYVTKENTDKGKEINEDSLMISEENQGKSEIEVKATGASISAHEDFLCQDTHNVKDLDEASLEEAKLIPKLELKCFVDSNKGKSFDVKSTKVGVNTSQGINLCQNTSKGKQSEDTLTTGKTTEIDVCSSDKTNENIDDLSRSEKGTKNKEDEDSNNSQPLFDDEDLWKQGIEVPSCDSQSKDVTEELTNPKIGKSKKVSMIYSKSKDKQKYETTSTRKHPSLVDASLLGNKDDNQPDTSVDSTNSMDSAFI